MTEFKYSILSPYDRWLEFVESNPDSHIFHHPSWISVLAESYGYKPFIVSQSNLDGDLNAGIPMMDVSSRLTGRRWIALPFTDHLSALKIPGIPTRGLYEYIAKLMSEKGIPRVEIRSKTDFDTHVYEDIGQVHHTLNISIGLNEIYKNFHTKGVKNRITKAEREGVYVRRAETEKDLDIYYDLHLTTRRRLGVPIQPKHFFRQIWSQMIQRDLGFILIVYRNSKPMAGGVFFTYKQKLVIKYRAFDRSYRQYSPTQMLSWAAIRWGCENDYQLLDSGKTDVVDIGLRNFKKNWGMKEVQLTYTSFTKTHPPKNKKAILNNSKAIIRRSPRWVCRLTGELLYRHFA